MDGYFFSFQEVFCELLIIDFFLLRFGFVVHGNHEPDISWPSVHQEPQIAILWLVHFNEVISTTKCSNWAPKCDVHFLTHVSEQSVKLNVLHARFANVSLSVVFLQCKWVALFVLSAVARWDKLTHSFVKSCEEVFLVSYFELKSWCRNTTANVNSD